jgi:hypothetical protein
MVGEVVIENFGTTDIAQTELSVGSEGQKLPIIAKERGWHTTGQLTPESLLLHGQLDGYGEVTLVEERENHGYRRVMVEISYVLDETLQSQKEKSGIIFRMQLPEFIEASKHDRDAFEASMGHMGVDLTQLDSIVSAWIHPEQEDMNIPWLTQDDITPSQTVFHAEASPEGTFKRDGRFQKVRENVIEIPVKGTQYKIFAHRMDFEPSQESLYTGKLTMSDAKTVWKVNINEPIVKNGHTTWRRVALDIPVDEDEVAEEGENLKKPPKLTPIEFVDNSWEDVRESMYTRVLDEAPKLTGSIQQIFDSIDSALARM